MNILRSPGPTLDPPYVIFNSLQSLHPPDTAPLQQRETPFTVPLSAFNFIDGQWLGKQLRRSKRGTAVDQWGWDSREMWRDILNDQPFLNDVAKYWILPLAAGYLPEKYRNHLAGGRLTALSKAPKPGIRPINVPDTWRRLAAKGLLTHCLTDLNHFFQRGHPRVFQFGTACPDGAAKMFHLINAIAITFSSQQLQSSKPLIIANLDLRNAFNEESRQLIYDFFASGCHIPPPRRKSSTKLDGMGHPLAPFRGPLQYPRSTQVLPFRPSTPFIQPNWHSTRRPSRHCPFLCTPPTNPSTCCRFSPRYPHLSFC